MAEIFLGCKKVSEKKEIAPIADPSGAKIISKTKRSAEKRDADRTNESKQWKTIRLRLPYMVCSRQSSRPELQYEVK